MWCKKLNIHYLLFHDFSHRYFARDGQHGVCVFRRRRTSEQGHRGFRLTSLGIILAKSRRPRPWRHLTALKELAESLYGRFTGSSASLELLEEDWEPARLFFEERKARVPDLGGVGDWNGWSHDLDVVSHRYKIPLTLSDDISPTAYHGPSICRPGDAHIASTEDIRPFIHDAVQTRHRSAENPDIHVATSGTSMYIMPRCS